MIKLNKFLLVILALTIIGLTAAIVYISVVPHSEDKFTEFYLLNKDGKASDYPGDIAAGQPAIVTLGIVNHEGDTAKYRIQATCDGAIISTIETGAVLNGQKWERTVDIYTICEASTQAIKFFLYMNGETTPHLNNPLVLNIQIVSK